MTSSLTAVSMAFLAGTFAALASLFAKLTLAEKTSLIAERLSDLLSSAFLLENTTLALVTRLACFLGIFASNAAMWTCFTKALNRSESSAKVTVVNSATNFCATAFIGNWFFDEPLSLRWYFGAGLIVIGSLMISQSTGKTSKEKANSSLKSEARQKKNS